MTQITINLPNSLVESAQCLGKATARELSEVLSDSLEIILPTFNKALRDLVWFDRGA